MTISTLRDEAHDHLSGAVDLRRRLHQWPETGNHLPITRDAVLSELDGLPLDISLHETTSGIGAILTGDKPGPTILLRGDMDAQLSDLLDGLARELTTASRSVSDSVATLTGLHNDLRTIEAAVAAVSKEMRRVDDGATRLSRETDQYRRQKTELETAFASLLAEAETNFNAAEQKSRRSLEQLRAKYDRLRELVGTRGI